ncbi:uncharacterized protein LOC108913338 [Anoplophora glabripennis]|uniref:uncharacterized protein LOC108913338 n=1 Tax=Anoplophora glabripennis TaxID=217634 RepID=UPI000875533F|nr:uncharacterized protein LOC108913338 [Anoplophora glabripennis]
MLRKHLMRFHDFTEEQFAATLTRVSSKKSNQPTVGEINTIKIEISKEILINACVELVTVNGRPFNLMADSGFEKILTPIKAGLFKKIKDKQFSLSPECIQKYVSKEANDLKLKIMEEVKHRMVSLKVDGVTRIDRSFLGINIQYTKNGCIVLRTLALKEINNKHTGDNLKRIIMDVCNSFEISADQIYTITTDNGTNLLKAVKVIASENGDYEVIENESDESGDEEVIEIVIEDENVENNSVTEMELDFGYNIFSDLFRDDCATSNDVPSTSKTSPSVKLNVTGMRCAAHTLQLAVENAMKQDEEVKNLILEARKIVKILRTQTYIYMLRKQKFKKPFIDCPTRWGSTFDMLNRLLELKEFCTEMEFTNFSKFKNMSDSNWNKIYEIVGALEPARKCTKKLQYEQLTLGSFYVYWQECKLTTEKIRSEFARIIVKNMEERENNLFNNDVFIAGIFLDPRLKIILNLQQMEKAKKHLKQLWVRLLTLKESNTVDSVTNKSNSDSGSDTTTSNDEMEVFLKKKETEHKFSKEFENSSGNTYIQIENILNSYQIEQGRVRISKDSTILEFWEKRKSIAPELYMLSQVLLAVPATQVSVERLFSGLKFLLPPTRFNIKDKILEQQLFVRTNRIFGDKQEKQLFAITKDTSENEVGSVEEKIDLTDNEESIVSRSRSGQKKGHITAKTMY